MRTIIPFLSALVLTIGLCGCSGSSGQARASSTSSSIQDAIRQAEPITPGVDAVVGHLGALQGSNADLKQAYADLQKSAKALATHITSLKEDVAAVRQYGTTYAADWEKKLTTVENADIAATSKTRLDQLRAGIERLSLAEGDYKNITEAFAKQLRDLKTALDLDLSPGGVTALRSAIGATIAAAPGVKQQTETVIDRLRGLEDFLGGAPAPAK